MELVTKYHPDKIADFVSEYLAKLAIEKGKRAAFETVISGGQGNTVHAYLFGETGLTSYPDIINYGHLKIRIVEDNVRVQSEELSRVADDDKFSDNCICHGVAKSTLAPYFRNRKVIDILENHGKEAKCLFIDDKVYVTMLNWEPLDLGVETVWLTKDWTIPGYLSDTGLTGRKLTNDFCGGLIPVGGGALAGKDWSKGDKLGAYLAMDRGESMYIKFGDPMPNYLPTIAKRDPENYINNWFEDYA